MKMKTKGLLKKLKNIVDKTEELLLKTTQNKTKNIIEITNFIE